MDYRFGCLGAILLVVLASPAGAQVTIPQEYDKLIKHSGQVSAFGNEGFGDQIDLDSGGLQIVQTDVDLPGNNALPVRVSRRFVTGDKYGGSFFGVWSLDIPYIHGIFGNHPNMPKGWRVPGGAAVEYKRCSQFAAPPDLLFQNTGHYNADEYWHGSFLHLPGGGDQELLMGGTTAQPTDGRSYPIVTKAGAVVRCVALASTSESGSQGEGFEVVTPDGLIYTLNQMVSRPNETISKPMDQNSLLKAGESNRQALPDDAPPPVDSAVNFTLARVEVRVYPTRVADRFGNTVTYTWSEANPGQLTKIVASDGRQITFTYGTNIVVSDGGHAWTYSNSGGAETVTLPDGSAWSFSLGALFNYKLQTVGDGCSRDVTSYGASVVTGSITAPSGAIALYTMSPVTKGRSWVPRECVTNSTNGEPMYALEPKGFVSLAVTSKKITGPGLPSAGSTWTYAYGAPNGCWIGVSPACTTSSPTTRTMTVTNPDGAVNRYTFGNRYSVNEGLQLKAEYGVNGATALRTVDTTYAAPNAAPYAGFNGSSPRQRGDVLMNDLHPQQQVTTTQQGRTFTWKVDAGCNGYVYCFDSWGRPTKITKSSSP